MPPPAASFIFLFLQRKLKMGPNAGPQKGQLNRFAGSRSSMPHPGIVPNS
jgi:hypothetical protein